MTAADLRRGWLGLYAAARKAGRSHATMIRLCREGRIYCRLCGIRWFFRADSLDKYIRRHRGRAA